VRVKEIMTRGAELIHPEATLREAAQRMKRLDVGSLPVCENDRLIGMVTDRDITLRATAEGLPPGLGRVRDVMTFKVVCCLEDDLVSNAARLMEEQQVRRLMVLDHDMRLAGMLSLSDLAVKSGDDELSAETLEQLSEPAAPRR